ncbi:uncharacterized protein LOC124260438 [Haliotis rubra]|uniref:uncharacterized protein LOC124260438 n=1 Tax=Haliotis rubra TaxID=36100 RepID=UPI001EE56656|nr:uncharacterized protein LOC124260438 [Haliotis rubra]
MPTLLQSHINRILEYRSDVWDQSRWNTVTRAFKEMWQFPYCTGAFDGKHIHIKNLQKSLYYYKNLLALADADYRFPWVNVGAKDQHQTLMVFNHSRGSDGGR